ncbi:hypothetical protein, partial [Klebsiella michiganensis]|uniref:hypothetical protein n=1 Tax=Klebsiella michiganensis TaxID=1134687 RepID=UPI000A3C8839
MVKSLSVMGITDSDFPMSSITGRANLLLTTSIGGGVHAGIKKGPLRALLLAFRLQAAAQRDAQRQPKQRP